MVCACLPQHVENQRTRKPIRERRVEIREQDRKDVEALQDAAVGVLLQRFGQQAQHPRAVCAKLVRLRAEKEVVEQRQRVEVERLATQQKLMRRDGAVGRMRESDTIRRKS